MQSLKNFKKCKIGKLNLNVFSSLLHNIINKIFNNIFIVHIASVNSMSMKQNKHIWSFKKLEN